MIHNQRKINNLEEAVTNGVLEVAEVEMNGVMQVKIQILGVSVAVK